MLILAEIKLFTYQELVKGAICVDAGKSEVAHQGITLVMEGSVNLQLSAKSVGLFEAFYSSLKVRIKYAAYNLNYKY